MRWLTLIVLVCVFCAPVMAQEATPSPEVPITIEHCITSASEPPKDWHIDGTILTYKQGDGVYGFRADFASRYYIAFDNDTEYGRFGSLSPDGKWFADYVGRKEYAQSWVFNSSYYVTAVRVVSTSPNGKSYTVPVDLYHYSQDASFAHVLWLDNTQFTVPGDPYSASRWRIVNPFAKTVSLATEDQVKQFERLYPTIEALHFNPDQIFIDSERNPDHDSKRAFFSKDFNGGKPRLLINNMDTHQVIDTCVETNSFVVAPNGEQVAVSIGGDKGFIYVVDLKDWALYRLDLAANTLVAWLADN